MDEYQMAEVNEALEAGERVLDCIDEVMSYLKSAKTWGYVDLFSRGSLISSLIKHSKLDDAQRSYKNLMYEIERFNDELDDVQVFDDGSDITMDGTMKFLDWFMDNTIVDIFALSHIAQSQKKIEDLEDQVVAIMEKLRYVKDFYDKEGL